MKDHDFISEIDGSREDLKHLRSEVEQLIIDILLSAGKEGRLDVSVTLHDPEYQYPDISIYSVSLATVVRPDSPVKHRILLYADEYNGHFDSHDFSVDDLVFLAGEMLRELGIERK